MEKKAKVMEHWWFQSTLVAVGLVVLIILVLVM